MLLDIFIRLFVSSNSVVQGTQALLSSLLPLRSILANHLLHDVDRGQQLQ